MSRRISHAIKIEASPAAVWTTLTDLESFPAWNPFILKIDGELRTGARLAVTIQPSGHRASTFRPTVLAVEPERELRWLGRFLIPGLFDGEHSFIVEPHGPDRARFVQHETFTGLLVPLVLRGMRSNIRRGFEEMNLALKARAEQG